MKHDDLDDGFASSDAAAWIDSARRGLEPRAEDAARVLHATRLAVAAAPGPTAPHGAAPTAASSPLALIAPKLVAALLIAGVSGAIGYRLGTHDAEALAHPGSNAPHVASIATHAAPPHDVATQDIATQKAAPVLALELPASNTALAVATELKDPSVDAGISERARLRRRLNAQRNEVAVAQPQVQAIEEHASDATSSENNALQSLDPEVRALRQVERALRQRDASRALTFLQQLDREVPSGKLNEERAAASAMARCELGLGSAMTITLEFSQRYPASMYFARVRETCASKPTDSQRR